jgi:DNA-binding protein H-NS
MRMMAQTVLVISHLTAKQRSSMEVQRARSDTFVPVRLQIFTSKGSRMPRTASLKSIEAQIQALQAKAEALKIVEKPGIRQLKAVLKKYKLTPSDIAHATNGARLGRRSKLKGLKVKPKYRNPANRSETWTGRGLKPRWMVAAIKGGKKLEDLAI